VSYLNPVTQATKGPKALINMARHLRPSSESTGGIRELPRALKHHDRPRRTERYDFGKILSQLTLARLSPQDVSVSRDDRACKSIDRLNIERINSVKYRVSRRLAAILRDDTLI